MEMDRELERAAWDGDVGFLREAVAVQASEYFIARNDVGRSIIDIAAGERKFEFMKEAINILPKNTLKQLLVQTLTSDLYNLLHAAALNTDISAVKCIREMYESLSWDDDEDHLKPWLALTTNNETPLNIALGKYNKDNEECVMEILLIDSELVSCTIPDKDGNTPLYYALKKGMNLVAENILKSSLPFTSIVGSSDLTLLLSLATNNCTEKTVRMLLEKFWWIIDLQDVQGNTALDYAKQENAPWLLNLLTNPSLIQKQGFDWIEAWNREENDAVITFARNCDDLRPFFIKNDTPLHHAKLATYKDYINFLQIPSIAELKNTTDHDGATPLHRALQRQDMNFAKALLIDDRVKRMIRNHAGTTSMDLLAKLCKVNKDWEKMCKEIKVNPYLRTTYILPGTNMEQMRTTLSVIAALLATITFAAGFTLPGGINSDNGQALLGKKAAFLVFLLADAYAMCTSMLVLFCLVWSMVSEPDMACLLVDRSVFILMQSLYATLLVFMTGIYVVIEHTSLWAAIVIFVMCSIIGIMANRTILHKVIAMLVPAAYREKLDQMRLLEEGNAGAFTAKEDKADKRE